MNTSVLRSRSGVAAMTLWLLAALVVRAQPADSPSDSPAAVTPRPQPVLHPAEFDGVGHNQATREKPASRESARQTLIASLFIFVLAVFVGFEVISKVPPTLHTPLMSGSNAISGITLVGAVIVAAMGYHFSTFIGCLAVIMATVNVVGGFLVTHRMLAMFRRK